MSAHSDHLPETFRNLAPWELAADALLALPAADGPVSDASRTHSAAETLAAYWTAQADVIRYGATLHAEAGRAQDAYENAGSVYEAFEVARTAAETFTRLQGQVRDAARRLREASATSITGITPEPLNGRTIREADARTAAEWQVGDDE